MSRYIGIMYRLNKLLPEKAMVKIFHSFIQSHLNYCSLVWGFSSKSKIESLFCTQKKAIRSIMPGFNNLWYHDGILPSHTKPHFARHNILTIHGIILKNCLIFMHKIHYHPIALPQSVRQLIRQLIHQTMITPLTGSKLTVTKNTVTHYLLKFNLFI